MRAFANYIYIKIDLKSDNIKQKSLDILKPNTKVTGRAQIFCLKPDDRFAWKTVHINHFSSIRKLCNFFPFIFHTSLTTSVKFPDYIKPHAQFSIFNFHDLAKNA